MTKWSDLTNMYIIFQSYDLSTDILMTGPTHQGFLIFSKIFCVTETKSLNFFKIWIRRVSIFRSGHLIFPKYLDSRIPNLKNFKFWISGFLIFSKYLESRIRIPCNHSSRNATNSSRPFTSDHETSGRHLSSIGG